MLTINPSTIFYEYIIDIGTVTAIRGINISPSENTSVMVNAFDNNGYVPYIYLLNISQSALILVSIIQTNDCYSSIYYNETFVLAGCDSPAGIYSYVII
jgi:hypothetical protein